MSQPVRRHVAQREMFVVIATLICLRDVLAFNLVSECSNTWQHRKNSLLSIPSTQQSRFSRSQTHGSFCSAIKTGSVKTNFRVQATSNSNGHHVNDDDDNDDDPVGKLSIGRRQELFQFLLRDLQVEGVPLLSVDISANNLLALQAAIWTTFVELREIQVSSPDYILNSTATESNTRKVCLVLEDFPISVLQSFARTFKQIQEEFKQHDTLSDLAKLKISLVGKGVGPGLILEIINNPEEAARDDQGKEAQLINLQLVADKCKEATNAFMDRIGNIILCDHSMENEEHDTHYRFSPGNDLTQILSLFWNCACELTLYQNSNKDVHSLLMIHNPWNRLPFQQFVSLTQILSRWFHWVENNGEQNSLPNAITLTYFHPQYQRLEITHSLSDNNADHTSIGHLSSSDLSNTDFNEIALYQRRSPVPVVALTSRKLSTAANQGKVDGHTRVMQTLKGIGLPSLHKCLNDEISIVNSTH
jgi:hypothetical protein